ncbi:MAG: permease-like cell division protein FtsX [Legionella sp.]|uniref:permease-like cell division protein FtsX n=1 Tax=Legionella sp. TaxID=459 RepID=UPI0039E56F3C
MLKKWHSLLAFHLQAATQSFNYLCNRPLATLMTSIVIAIALALPALFWVFSDNIHKLTADWQRGGYISLYLKVNLADAQQQKIVQRIRETEGVAQASLKSAAEGLSELTQQEGMQDIMQHLPENPLPAVIHVVPALNIDSPAKLDLLSRQLQSIPEVEQAKVDMEWIRRLDAILGFATNFANALLALLALAVILIIGTTLRLALHSRHEEIQVLKLIGAKDPFILRPFLYSGVWYGVIGAIFAVFLVNIFILSLGMAVNQLVTVYQIHYSLNLLSIRQVLILIIFAIILGLIGARLSVKRQLASMEPHL